MSVYQKDEERLKRLATGDNREWKLWYDDMRSPFRAFFMRHSAVSPEEAVSLSHETMVVFHRNVPTGKLTPPLQSALRTYLFGIGKLVFKKSHSGAYDWDDDIPDMPVLPEVEDRAEQEAQAALVRSLLERIGDPCRQILTLVYIKGYAMESVATEMGIASEGAARKRKFDCLQKLRDLVKAP
ncbi:MAG TPA: sigma factor-like helix-turn-helix DNA-binding protein [Flavilitoribacter sp.]|nr:sigma factor-like helix-turn-helix DNA-binding protein [Flavilitoribacter sp.]